MTVFQENPTSNNNTSVSLRTLNRILRNTKLLIFSRTIPRYNNNRKELTFALARVAVSKRTHLYKEKSAQTKQNDAHRLGRLVDQCCTVERTQETYSMPRLDTASDGRHSIYIGGKLTGVRDE